MAITGVQKAFCDVATQYSTDLLQAHFSLEKNDSGTVDALETTGTAIETVEAGILIAGTIAAPGTAGISLGAAAAIVVLAKAGKAFYDWTQAFSGNPDEGQYPIEVQKDLTQLRLRVQLHRALYLFTLRYADVIETVVDKKSLRHFAEQTAARLLKFQLAHEEDTPGTLLPAEDLLDLLLSSAKINVIKQADSVAVQHPNIKLGIVKSNSLYSKYLWALPVWYIYDKNGDGEFVGSQNEHAYLRPTTHIECGVIALPKEKLQLNKLAADLHSHKILTEADLGRSSSALLKTLWIRHHVTYDEMQAYLSCVRQPRASSLSLNDYLSQHYKKPMIACCHDSRFKGCDLRGGHFSGVDFSDADLSDCDLKDTNWSGCYTWLTKAIFNRVQVNQNSFFQEAHAEESVWTDVSFLEGVNFLFAKFNGAKFIHCTMEIAGLMQLGADWLLATFFEPVIVDKQMDLQKEFQEKLNTEQKERQQLKNKIKVVTKSLDAQTRLLATQIQTNTENTQHSWVLIQDEITDLKRQSALFPGFDSRLTLLLEQYQRLEAASFSEQSAIAELQHFHQEEESRWSWQSQKDAVFDQRLADLENTHSVWNRLIHYCREEVDTSNFQFIKTAFIELLCSAFLHSKDTPESLTECTDKFIANGKGFFLLHGDPGCGRTTFLKLLYIELIEKVMNAKQANVTDASHVDATVWMPVLIDMHEVQDRNRNRLRVALETRLDIGLVDKLIESEHCLIMVDNLDVGNIPLQKFVEDCIELAKKFKYPPKFIFSTKTSYLFSLGRDYHEFFMTADFNLDTERVIQPFNKNQIKQFFSRYHKDSIYRQFLAMQLETPEIRSMLQSPLLLSIIVGAFHSSSFNADKMTLRGDFYAESWRALHEHVRPLLPEEYKDYDDFTDLIQRIAIDIYKNGSNSLERKRHLTPSSRNRDPLNALEKKIQYLSFLLITKKPSMLQVRFLHPSLGHYWIAQKLLADLCEDDYLSQTNLELWNLHNFRDYPDILSFLVELIQKAELEEGCLDLQARLMAIVTQTADPAKRHSVMASANAMTVRCRLNKHIDLLSLDNVQIPGFDGTGVSAIGTSIRNACLKGAWLMDAMLLWADTEGSDLTDIRFLNASSFIQVDGTLKTFAIYPSLCEKLIAYVVKPESSFRNHQIALMRIQNGHPESLNGQPEKIISWPAHAQDIYTLAFAVSADESTVLLASAGEGGTVRIWRFNQSNGSVERIAKFHASKKTPIYVLAWSPDANYLAVGSDDGHVRIWDTQTLRKIYKSSKFSTSAIRALIWNQQNRLFAIDDGNILHIWENPQQSNPDLRLKQIDLTIFTPIRHMAMTKDGRSLALTQGNGDVPVVLIEEGGSYRSQAVFHGHKRKVNQVCWAGNLLITASDDETGRIWHDPRYHRILPHGHAVERLALSINEQEAIFGVSHAHSSLTTGASSRLYFWNVYPFHGEHLPQDTLGRVTCINTYAMPDQSLRIVAGYINGVVMLYTVDEQKQITEKLLWESEGISVSQVAWSADGRFIASLYQDGTMVIKDVNQTEEKPLLILQKESGHAINHFVWVKTANFTTLFITVDMSGSILIYDAAAPPIFNVGHMKMSVMPPLLSLVDFPSSSSSEKEKAPSPALCVAIPDRQHSKFATVVAVSREACVEIWSIDLEKAQKKESSFVKSLVFPHQNQGAVMLSWSPNGDYLVSLDSQRTVYVWNDSTCLYTYKHTSPIHSLIWSEHYLIAGTPTEMLVWDTMQEDIWSQSPKITRIGAPLLNAINQHFVIGDNKAIWLCSRSNLFSDQRAASWIATIKPDLLLHGAKISTQVSEANKAFLKQKGAEMSTHRRLGFFGSWRKDEVTSAPIPIKFPPPVKRAELEQLFLSRHSSMQSLIKGSSDSSSGSEQKILAGNNSPGIILG